MSNKQTIPGNGRRQFKAILKGLVLIATLVAAAWAFRAAGLDHALDKNWIDQEIRGHGALGWLMFIGATALATGIGLPRQIPSFLGGYAFGVVGGTLLATLGTGLSCAFLFLYARFMGREFVAARFGRRIAKVDNFLKSSPFSMTLVIRFMPIGNNLLTNLIAGVTSVGFGAFVGGSTLGYVPQTLIFALLGSGVRVDPTLRISLAVVLFVGATWWGFRLYRKYRAAALLENGE